jgi:hypothetical protein
MLLKLLGAPVSLPMAGMKFILQQIADLADQELYDPAVVHEQLMLLQLQLEEGDIDQQEYAEREAELMARLREIKARNQQQPPAEADVAAPRRVLIETALDETE